MGRAPSARERLPGSDLPLTFDANGNLATQGGSTYAFDAENRLKTRSVSGGTVTHLYDGVGTQVKRTNANGSWTVYVEGIFEKDSTAAVRKYYQAYGRPIAMRDGTRQAPSHGCCRTTSAARLRGSTRAAQRRGRRSTGRSARRAAAAGRPSPTGSTPASARSPATPRWAYTTTTRASIRRRWGGLPALIQSEACPTILKLGTATHTS